MAALKRWIGYLLLFLLLAPNVLATNDSTNFAAGNAIWIDSNTQISGYEGQIVANLSARGIRNIFRYTVSNSPSQYAAYGKFAQVAHSSNMTLHAICAEASTVTSNGVLSAAYLSNAIAQLVAYNNSTNAASQFDGVQVDIEGVSGQQLLTLLQGVTVSSNLYFSAVMQTDEGASGIESYYSQIISTTSVDMLIPMIYIMDYLGYSGGNLVDSFCISTYGSSTSIGSKTSELLALLPSSGRLMCGLSCYDYETAVTKGGGPYWGDTGGWWGSEIAFAPGGSYNVPALVSQGIPLYSVAYMPGLGISNYRFNLNSTNWFDVNEMTPIGVGQSIAAANAAGAGNPRYAGAAVFKYFTIFDSTSERQWGLTMNDTTNPVPQIGLQVLSIVSNVATLQVSLTNGNPSEQILGDAGSAGVHLELQGATFMSADPGSFHAALPFNSSSNPLSSIDGAQYLELRRYFFENLSSQGALSGNIQVSALAPFTIRYRAWMTSKDRITNNVPYIARVPYDVPTNIPSGFTNYATYATNVTVASICPYVAAVGADLPVCYLRFSETGVVTTPSPFTAANLGTLGALANGSPLATNYGINTTILGLQPGALANPPDTSFLFSSAVTNPINIPYRPEWNLNAPFSVELWLKGGTAFACPASSIQYDQAGWLFYQGDSSQATGNGWWFRVYIAGGTRISAQANMTVSPTAWCYIVGVYDGTNALLYTNGVLATSTALGAAYAPNTATTNLTFGNRSDGHWSYGGCIDQPAFYTNALSASQVAAHYAAANNAANYTSQVLAQHPPGYWPFNDALNPPVAANLGIGGSALNGAYLNWSTTVPDFEAPAYPGLETANTVLEVCGTNGQVLIPPLNLNTNAVTFECWLKRNGNQSSYAGLVMHRNSADTNACGLGFHGTSNHLGYSWNDAANTYDWDSGLLPPNGQWTYAALTINAAQAVISMCDGTTWSSATNAVANAVQAFSGVTRVGSDGGLSGRWFNGSLDEVAIYDASLTQAQLMHHALSAFGNTNQPLFTLLPVSQTVQFGAPAAFDAATLGAPTIYYQWLQNGASLAGATNPTLSFATLDYTNDGQYTLTASNAYGGVISPAVTLTVTPPPSVTNLTYRVSATGSGSAQNLELIWPSGTLYSATNLNGPWSIVSGVTEPYYYSVPIDPSTASLFFEAK